MVVTPRGFSTSTNLLRRVQANQTDAWRRLIDCYGPLVWHWCRQADLEPHDRADVFQQVFLAVFRKIRDFVHSPDRGSFRGWLLIITQNQIRDHFRRIEGRAVASGGTDAHQRLMALADPDSDDSGAATGVHIRSRDCCGKRWSESGLTLSPAPGRRSGKQQWTAGRRAKWRSS